MFWNKNRSNNGNKRDDLESRIREENKRFESDDETIDAEVVKEPKVSNNGNHKNVATIDSLVYEDTVDEIKVVDEEVPLSQSQGRQVYIPDDEDDKPDIPGKGFLYHAKDENMGEATRLNEREIVMFALGDTQESILDPKRKSVYQTFRNSLFRYKIALNGDGRKEAIELKTMEAERAADRATGAFGGVKF